MSYTMYVMDGCTDERRRKQAVVTTANAIYRCEEFEDAVSVYDDIQENTYDDLNENPIYLDVLGDDEGCDSECKPQPPSPRPVTESQDQNKDNGYVGLRQDKPDHIYLHLLNDESASRDPETDAEAQDQSSKPEEQ